MDAYVVGSGPNGLAAALTLAAAGLAVTVLEAHEQAGGGLRSVEPTLPGLVHDECAGLHPLVPVSPFFEHLMRTADVAFGHAPVQYAHPLDTGGASAALSLEGTARELGLDGARWRGFFGPLAKRFDRVAPDILLGAGSLPRNPIGLATLGARAPWPGAASAKIFRTPQARALWSGLVAHGFAPAEGWLTSAIAVVLGSAAHSVGWPVVLGGSGRLAEEMVAEIERRGGSVETGRRVRDVRELGEVAIVMLDTSPEGAVDIAGSLLPDRTRRAYSSFRRGPGAFQMALAVEGGIPWRYEPARRASTVHVSGEAHETFAALRAVNAGRMPERPFVLVGQQYVADPGRVREGVAPVDLYAHVPHGHAGDVTEAVLGQLERFAPGVRDRIVGMSVRDPARIAAENSNFIGGDILTGAKGPLQLLGGPGASLNPYRTGAAGLYLCSAATPPGPGAHGMGGYLAARVALKDLGVPLP